MQLGVNQKLKDTSMKQIIFILIISFFGIIGCKDNSVNPYDESPLVNSLQGKFVNWTKGEGHRILFLGANDVWNSDKIYGYSKIDSNGYFSIRNFDIPSTSFLVNTAYPVYMDGTEFQENSLTCSDSSAKVVYGVLIIVKDTSNMRVAEVYRQNFDYNFWLNEELLKYGDFMSEYIYSDKDVSLKGKVKYIYNSPYFNRESRMTYNYNLNFKKGWNRRVTYIFSYNVTNENGKTVITAEINYINFEPSFGSWHYLYY
jgi:hypothetical protein